MTDEQILQVLRQQDALNTETDFISFARAVIQEYENSQWKPLTDDHLGPFLAYLPNNHVGEQIQIGASFKSAETGRIFYDTGDQFTSVDDIALIRDLPQIPKINQTK